MYGITSFNTCILHRNNGKVGVLRVLYVVFKHIYFTHVFYTGITLGRTLRV